MGVTLDKVVREGLSEVVAFELRPERQEAAPMERPEKRGTLKSRGPGRGRVRERRK